MTVQGCSEKIGDGSYFPDALGVHFLPLPLPKETVGSFKTKGLGYLKVAEPGIVGACHFFGIARGYPAHGQFHVRLPRTQPHLAYPNLLNLFVVRPTADTQSIRPAGAAGGQFHLPTTVGFGMSGIGMSPPVHFYFSPCFGITPNGYLRTALQHHTLRKEGRHLQLAH